MFLLGPIIRCDVIVTFVWHKGWTQTYEMYLHIVNCWWECESNRWEKTIKCSLWFPNLFWLLTPIKQSNVYLWPPHQTLWPYCWHDYMQFNHILFSLHRIYSVVTHKGLKAFSSSWERRITQFCLKYFFLSTSIISIESMTPPPPIPVYVGSCNFRLFHKKGDWCFYYWFFFPK